MDVEFYIKDLSSLTIFEIETTFKVKYMSCTGLEELGKPKNIYTETYADADKLRLYQPSTIAREATKITFTFAFFGDKTTRQKLYDDFNSFLEGKRLSYCDTARLRMVKEMVLMDKTEPKEDMYKGQGYITAEYTFQNLYGECERLNNINEFFNS